MPAPLLAGYAFGVCLLCTLAHGHAQTHSMGLAASDFHNLLLAPLMTSHWLLCNLLLQWLTLHRLLGLRQLLPLHAHTRRGMLLLPFQQLSSVPLCSCLRPLLTDMEHVCFVCHVRFTFYMFECHRSLRDGIHPRHRYALCRACGYLCRGWTPSRRNR